MCTEESRRGQCFAEDEAALQTVSIELEGGGVTFVAARPAFTLNLVAQTDGTPTPGDRIGLIAPWTDGIGIRALVIGFDGGPCYAVGDFGLHALPQTASFEVTVDESVPAGSVVVFYAWATGWPTDCTSPLFSFSVRIE